MGLNLNYRKQAGDEAWQGAVNARHICGVFYRMGRHEWVTPQGWQQMHATGIRAVFDLRNPEEIHRREHDPAVPQASMAGIQLMNLPLEAPGNERFEAIATPYMHHTGMYQLVCEEFGNQLRAVCEKLADVEDGAVIHCSAGRDRSGLIATILLDLAGRRDQVMFHDELAVRGINEWHRVSPRKHPYESYREEPDLQMIINNRASELGKFLAWLGSADQYLLAQGMNVASIERLRKLAQCD